MPVSVRHLEEEKSKLVTSLLAKWTDGLYYAAEILDRDIEARRFLVKFLEDNKQQWTTADELHAQLDVEQVTPEDLVCSICDGGESDPPNEIIICDLCQQGYHIQCHRPTIDRRRNLVEDELIEWFCSTCKELADPKRSQASTIIVDVGSQVSSGSKKPTRKSNSQTPKVKLTKPKAVTTSKKASKVKTTTRTSNVSTRPSGVENEPVTKKEPVVETTDVEIIKKEEDVRVAKDVTNKKRASGVLNKMTKRKPTLAGDKTVSMYDKKSKGDVQKMGPLVIGAARALVNEENVLSTEELVSMITCDDARID